MLEKELSRSAAEQSSNMIRQFFNRRSNYHNFAKFQGQLEVLVTKIDEMRGEKPFSAGFFAN